MTSIHAPSRRPVLLAPGQGEARWLGGHLLDWKLHGRDSGGQLAAVETVIPRGQEPPLHVHEHDDELFYVLEGEATFICGDEESTGGPGSTALLPRGVPHTLRVETETVRALVVMTPVRAGAVLRDAERAGDEPLAARRSPPTSTPRRSRPRWPRWACGSWGRRRAASAAPAAAGT